jgi:hypothetical protein
MAYEVMFATPLHLLIRIHCGGFDVWSQALGSNGRIRELGKMRYMLRLLEIVSRDIRNSGCGAKNKPDTSRQA